MGLRGGASVPVLVAEQELWDESACRTADRIRFAQVRSAACSPPALSLWWAAALEHEGLVRRTLRHCVATADLSCASACSSGVVALPGAGETFETLRQIDELQVRII